MIKPPYPLVYVEWQDAAHNGGWGDANDEKTETLPVCQSIGWLVQKDKERIVIAGSLNLEVNQIGNRQYIPHKMITKMVKRKMR